MPGYILGNRPADGGVTLMVDGYGSFGSSVGSAQGNAFFDVANGVTNSPIFSTTFESGLAIRLTGDSGRRRYLTMGQIGNGNPGSNMFCGDLPTSLASGTDALSATSAFTFSGLDVTLLQELTAVKTSSNVQLGSLLSQTYTFTNTTGGTISGDVVRYFDGDFAAIANGGGRQVRFGDELLCNTPTVVLQTASQMFCGISLDATGSAFSVPPSGRFEMRTFGHLRNDIGEGTPMLFNTVVDRSPNDNAASGNWVSTGYDITSALRVTYSLAAAESGTMTTKTYWIGDYPSGSAPAPSPEVIITRSLGFVL